MENTTEINMQAIAQAIVSGVEIPRAHILTALGLTEDGQSYDAIWGQFAAAAAGGGDGGPNVVSVLPGTPIPNFLYWLTLPVLLEAALSGVDYTAVPKSTPDAPPQDIPLAVFDSSLFNGVKLGFSYCSLDDVASAMDSLMPGAFVVTDGGGVMAWSIALNGGLTYFYIEEQATINAVTVGPGWCQALVDGSGIVVSAAQELPYEAMSGTWNFGQVDIDSGAVAAFMDVSFPAGPCYFDGTDWIPLKIPDENDLEGRVAAIENAIANAGSAVGVINW